MVKAGSWHPLHSALIFGDLDKAKSVFERGNDDAGMLKESNEKGWKALHFASHSGHVDSVSLLGRAWVALPRVDRAARANGVNRRVYSAEASRVSLPTTLG